MKKNNNARRLPPVQELWAEDKKEVKKIDNGQLTMGNERLRTDIEEDDTTMSWYRHSEEDIRKMEEFEEHRDYESLTPEEVDWMMTEIKGYWPNLPIAISLAEPEIRERVFAKRRAEKKAKKNNGINK